MNPRLAISISAAAAFAVLVCVPAGAAAKPGYSVVPGTIAVEVSLPKDNGYYLELSALGRKRVSVVAHRGTASVLYIAPGHVSSRRVTANFGRFGRIDLRFHPATAVRRRSGRRRACHGRKSVERFGTYAGTIRFRDPGVVNIAPRRAFGTFERSFRTVCKTGRGHHHGRRHRKLDLELKLLSARAQQGNRVVSFEAASFAFGGPLDGLELTFVGGGLREDFGRVLVFRQASELAEEGEVVFSRRGKHPERVTVAAPPPFAGRATYLENPSGAASWTGNLSVPLPGRGRVALTGDGFHARVCRARSFAAFFDCAAPSGSSSALRLNSPPGLPLPPALRGPTGRAALRSATLR